MADLYDKLTRHQVYLEGVKAWAGDDFNDTLTVLRKRLDTVMFAQPHAANLGDMTALQYRAFYQRMQNNLNNVTKRSSGVLMDDFKGFAKTDKQMLDGILRSEKGSRRRTPADSVIWNQASKRPLGANGLTLQETVDAYYASMKREVLQRIKMGRVNNESLAAVRADINGRLMTKFRNQANSLIATAYQHISSVIQSYIEAMFYERYRWVAVLDEKTTDICRSRDGKTWRYGKGPIPPAHYNCRSKIVPVQDNNRNIPASYFGWLKDQPAAVLRDIVGNDAAQTILDGKGSATQFPKFMGAKQIPLDKFKDKMSLILAD